MCLHAGGALVVTWDAVLRVGPAGDSEQLLFKLKLRRTPALHVGSLCASKPDPTT